MTRRVRMRLAALAIAALGAAGCAPGSGAHESGNGPHHPPAVSAVAAVGRPGNPLVFSCDETSSFPDPQSPSPSDLVVGPLWIINGRDSVAPSGAGPHPQHSYKYPIAVAPGATVTMTIASSAQGHIVIDNPYGPAPGVIAATYHACPPSSSQSWSVFVQGFAFTDGRTRGCVPLTVQSGRETRIRRVTVSLYAGPCAS